MSGRWLAPLLAAAVAVAPAQAQEANSAAVDLALARGQLLYAYDQAAWHGTDDMVAKIANPERKVGGWIVDGPAASPTLIFFDRDAADPHAVYVAEFRGNKLASSRVLGPEDDRTLSPARKALVAARAKGIDAWAAARPLYCAQANPNVAVLPPERPGGPHLVYVMTPQTENLAWPFGGHWRVEINPDGGAGASRSFANSCVTVRGERGRKNAAMFITHLLDPIPTEIHVFTALASGAPVMVGTGDEKNMTMWVVTGTEIASQKLK